MKLRHIRRRATRILPSLRRPRGRRIAPELLRKALEDVLSRADWILKKEATCTACD